jgi:hypothetical protein
MTLGQAITADRTELLQQIADAAPPDRATQLDAAVALCEEILRDVVDDVNTISLGEWYRRLDAIKNQ